MVASYLSLACALAHLVASQSYDSVPVKYQPTNYCRELQVTGNETTYFRDTQIRISPGVICSEANETDSKGCKIEAGGFWLRSTTYNLTFANYTGDFNGIMYYEGLWGSSIDWTVAKYTSDTTLWNGHNQAGSLKNTTLYVSPDDSPGASESAAYISFLNEYRCISGLLNQCPQGLGLANGTYFQACVPLWAPNKGYDGYKEWDGSFATNIVNSTYASTIPTNEYATKNTLHGVPQNGAAILRPSNTVLLGLVILVTFSLTLI